MLILKRSTWPCARPYREKWPREDYGSDRRSMPRTAPLRSSTQEASSNVPTSRPPRRACRHGRHPRPGRCHLHPAAWSGL